MQTFKRHSAAVFAAQGRAYVAIKIGGKSLYIVPDDGEALDTSDGVELIGTISASGNREIAGHVGFGHLDRLGNANGAAADVGEWKRGTAFPIEARRGMLHKFQSPAEAGAFAADKDGFLAGSRGAHFAEADAADAFEARKHFSPGSAQAARAVGDYMAFALTGGGK